MDMQARMRELYLEQDMNCAETTLKLADEEFGLGIGGDGMAMIGAFGGGMACGRACGALCAGAAAIGRVMITGRAHATDGLGEVLKSYVASFERELGGVDCVDVKPRNFVEGERCLATVRKNMEILRGAIRSARGE